MSYLFPPQCIVCEGERDRIVLAELAARVLRGTFDIAGSWKSLLRTGKL